jgi:phenylpropionate dioxygenase-like ring-hydroxylating dioxygenase large terminal subunit
LERHDERELIERVLRHLRDGTGELGDATSRQPVEDYLDPAIFERELALIFGCSPLVIGHVSRLPAPGSFFTETIAGVPLLLTRPREGETRAHINACRHRGTLLVAAQEGTSTTFTCPYHAWTYHADGRLLGVAHEKTFGPIDRACHGLVSLPVVERAGLLWVGLERESALELDVPDALATQLDWLGMSEHVVLRSHRQRWRFNWKLGVDGGLEAYHFRHAHAASIYPLFFDNLLVYDAYGPHARLTLPKRTISEAGNAPTARIRDHANLLYFLFPNCFLIAQSDYVALIRMTPISALESDIEIAMVVPERPTSDRARRYWDINFDLLVGALDEDFRLGERIQATLASGANPHLTFGRNEMGLTRFHASVFERLAQAVRT